jgi:hypothetical protein
MKMNYTGIPREEHDSVRTRFLGFDPGGKDKSTLVSFELAGEMLRIIGCREFKPMSRGCVNCGASLKFWTHRAAKRYLQ